MDKGKLANLARETELGLFRANKELKALAKVSGEIELLLKNLSLLEQSAERSNALRSELLGQMKKRQIVGQSHELFNQLGALRRGLAELSDLQEKTSSFVEKYRTGRLYAFEDAAIGVKFARKLLEMFSVQSIVFKPRFIGTIDLDEISTKLGLKKSNGGLLLQPKDVKNFVKLMSAKRFASNISLEAPSLKLVWQDKKTIAVDSSPEKLYRLDRLCDALQGKCLEK